MDKKSVDKKSIEEQVAELTQEQQDKILKVGKTAMIWQLVVGVPWFIFTILGFFTLTNPPIGFDYSNFDKLYLGYMTFLVIGAAYLVGVLVFVKIKYPFYSDAKWKYINKMRKGK